jgi:carboxymethylenebutenolidase
MSDSIADQAMDSELKSLAPEKDWTRRSFVVSVLASGFALATQPVSAQTITTDARGLTAGEIKGTGQRRRDTRSIRALPATGGPHPVVLVGAGESSACTSTSKDICRRLAKSRLLRDRARALCTAG